jgi:hypothetical protein
VTSNKEGLCLLLAVALTLTAISPIPCVADSLGFSRMSDNFACFWRLTCLTEPYSCFDLRQLIMVDELQCLCMNVQFCLLLLAPSLPTTLEAYTSELVNWLAVPVFLVTHPVVWGRTCTPYRG